MTEAAFVRFRAALTAAMSSKLRSTQKTDAECRCLPGMWLDSIACI